MDLIEDDDQITHTITLDDDMKPENELSSSLFFCVLLRTIFVCLDIFSFDKDFLKNEEIYEEIRKEIIGDPDASDDEEEDEEADEDEEEPGRRIHYIDRIQPCFFRKCAIAGIMRGIMNRPSNSL